MTHTPQEHIVLTIGAVLCTLAETGGSTETMLYIGACGMDLLFWHTIRGIMLRAGLVKVSANYVTLTPTGRSKADKLNKLIAAKAN